MSSYKMSSNRINKKRKEDMSILSITKIKDFC